MMYCCIYNMAKSIDMKRIIFVLTAVLAMVSLASCDKDSFDATRVVFSNEGGTQTVRASIYTLSITDKNGREVMSVLDEVSGMYVVTVDWLTASMPKEGRGSREITLTAEKNTTGKKRRLYIGGMDTDFSVDIPVIQHK